MANTDERYTPPWLVEKIRRTLGGIELDPCTCDEAQKIVAADRYYTIEDDGLSQEWTASTLYLNPPYSGPRPWIEKWKDQSSRDPKQRSCVLVRLAFATRWSKILYDHGDVAVFLWDRVRFLDHRGNDTGKGKIDSALVFVGTRYNNVERHFGDVGKVVRL